MKDEGGAPGPEEIRREIAVGLDQARAGQLVDADEVFDQLEAELAADDVLAPPSEPKPPNL